MSNIEQTERAHNFGPMNGGQGETLTEKAMTEKEKQMDETVYVIECTGKAISECYIFGHLCLWDVALYVV